MNVKSLILLTIYRVHDVHLLVNDNEVRINVNRIECLLTCNLQLAQSKMQTDFGQTRHKSHTCGPSCRRSANVHHAQLLTKCSAGSWPVGGARTTVHPTYISLHISTYTRIPINIGLHGNYAQSYLYYAITVHALTASD